MTVQTLATIQGYFNTGDVPTETQFADAFQTAIGSDDIVAALSGAASPSASNVFATMAAVANPLGKYPNVVVVAADGSGHYTTLSAAIAAITDASATNRYLVKFVGKTVETSNVVAKRYVDVVGIGIGAEISGAVQVQMVGGAVDDQNWSNLKISCAVATSAVSCRSTFWNCYLSGGLVDTNGAWQSYFRNCKISGTWPATGAASTFDFSNCEISGVTTINTVTVRLRNCNTTFGAATIASGVTVTVSSGTLSYTSLTITGTLTVNAGVNVSGGSLAVNGSLNLYNSFWNFTAGGVTFTGVTKMRNSHLEGSLNGVTLAALPNGGSLTMSNSSIINTNAGGTFGLYITGTPTLFLAMHSAFICQNAGGGVGLDADDVYEANVFLSVISPSSLTMTFTAGTASGSNITF